MDPLKLAEQLDTLRGKGDVTLGESYRASLASALRELHQHNTMLDGRISTEAEANVAWAAEVSRLKAESEKLEKTVRVMRFAANLRLTHGMVKKLRTEAICEDDVLKFCTCGEMLWPLTAAEAYERKVEEGEK